MSSIKKEKTTYNVNDYTDQELFTILDLTNPTDRELEAKILFLYNRYKNMQTDSGNDLADFFNDIYNRFFETAEEFANESGDETEDDETDEENHIETLENMDDENVESGNIQGNYYGGNTNASTILPLTTYIDTSPEPKPIKKDEEETKTSDGVSFTKPLGYAQDKLNPLLQQTIKRIVSIDSQYRDDKTTMATEFTFNLSEPLKDVVSIKLYSIQIPYTWYTVSRSYGSNFFYLKGNVPGINTGDDDFKIDISAGNYTPPNLVAALNTKFQEIIVSNPDISFGNTNISYNPNTSLTTFTINITKIYNESSYYLDFPAWTNPNSDSSITGPRFQSIPGFFGFNNQNYYFNTLNSSKNLLLTTNTAGNNADFINGLYYIDPSNSEVNNYFTIYKYIGPNEYSSKSIVDVSFNITLSSTGVLSRTQLVNDLSYQLSIHPYLQNSSITRHDIIDPSLNGHGNSYFQIKLNYNRLTTNNIENTKTYIVFPQENTVGQYYPVWTGPTSCFRFQNTNNELNNIVSETSPIQQQSSRYIISNRPYIYLKCVKPYYDVSINDYQVTLNNSSTAGYSLLQYISAINTSFSVANNATITTKNTTGDFNLQNTLAYIDNESFFNLQLDYNKIFDQDNYYIDLSGSFLKNLLDLSGAYLNGVEDLSGSTYSFYSSFEENARYIVNSNYLLVANPSIKNYGNQNKSPFIVMSEGIGTIYYSYQELETAINNAFANFSDEDNTNIFIGSNVSLTPNVLTGNIDCVFTIKMKKILTQVDYKIGFYDASSVDIDGVINPVASSWYYNLKLHESLLSTELDASGGYILANGDYNTTITNTTKSYTRIRASYFIAVNNIKLTKDVNDYFILKPFVKGVYTEGNENDIRISIPAINPTTGTAISYTRDNLLTAINTAFNETALTKGSSISIVTNNNIEYTKLRITINKKYTSADYRIVFYDQISYLQINLVDRTIRNTTWDTTIGWLIGFHNSTEYVLSDYASSTSNAIKLTGDTTVSTNLFNYFLLCLDDFNQNHLNDGLVTASTSAMTVSLPTYANRSNYTVDPVTGLLTYNTNMENVNGKENKLTQNQIYTLTEIANSKRTSSIISTSSNVNAKSYGAGPFAKDVFGLIPMKTTGMSNGSVYIEFGGTLQQQERLYFGPVNINRMSVKLMTDRGDVVDLNGSNWSFSLICEQLYQQKPTIDTKSGSKKK